MSDIGIDFRATSGYATDPANCTYCLGETYPVTRGGRTFGYTVGPADIRDRDNTVDPRLVGENFATVVSGTVNFQLDGCDTGSNDTYVAIGDPIYGSSYTDYSSFEILDGSTSLYSFAPSAITGSNMWRDANDIQYTSAGWVAASAGGGTVRTVTMSGTELHMKYAGTTFGPVGHLRVIGSAAAGIAIPVLERQYRQRWS